MDTYEIDRLQGELFRHAGLDPHERAHVTDLARGHGLRVVLLRDPWFPGDGALTEIRRGEFLIQLRDGVSLTRRRFALAHEVAEWVFRSVHSAQLEEQCNALAAAFIAPRRPFQRWYRQHGLSLSTLAEQAGSSQTSAALRVGETLGIPVAVVTRTYSFARARELTAAQAEELRRHPRKQRPGLARLPIRDARGRAAWVAAA